MDGTQDPAMTTESTPSPVDAGALAGITVIDLTWSWAGPLGTRILADLGAEVIKIEGIQRPDWTRYLYYPENDPGPRPWETGGYFHELNRNKRSVVLNLAHDEGRRLLRELLQTADVFLENFSPRVKEGWGFTFNDLRAHNSRLIMVSMSGFGQQGPLREFVAFGPTMESMAGITSLGGPADAPPSRVGVMYGDPISGFAIAAGVMTALYEREITGEGQYVDIAGTEACMGMIGEAIAYAAAAGVAPPRSGDGEDGACLSGCFPCAGDDRWIAVSCRTAPEVAALARVLHLDAASLSGERRDVPDPAIRARIARQTRARPAEALAATLQEAGVAATVVMDSHDLVTDAHLAERGFLLQIPHPLVGARTMAGPLFPGAGLERAPETMVHVGAYGSETAAVLHERLGLSGAEIETLRREGVTTDRPAVEMQYPPAPIAIWRQIGLIR